jgi:hypothetical protein
MPFILRGVSVLGVASAGTARDIRDAGSGRQLAGEWKPAHLDRIATQSESRASTDLPGVFR